jgi:hypothetical protein
MAKNYGELYNIEGWGDPYFTVNKDGHLCVRIYGRETIPGRTIDVLSVIDQAMTVDRRGGAGRIDARGRQTLRRKRPVVVLGECHVDQPLLNMVTNLLPGHKKG